MLALDDNELDSELINKLLKIAPSFEETEKLLKYDGNSADLCKIEVFLRDIIQVPSLTERLECMLFKNKFDYEIKEL